MNGLQVRQVGIFQSYSFSQTPSGTVSVLPSSDANAVPIIIQNQSPSQLSSFINSIAATTDTKVYIRQVYMKGVYYNNSNTPIIMYRYSFRFRKNVATADFASINAILTRDNPNINDPLVNPFTSQIAQRLMKFGRVKAQYMACGAMGTFKLNNKYYNPKLVNQETEGDSVNYLAMAGNKCYMFKCTPVPIAHFAGATTPVTILGTSWGSWSVSFNYMSYVSGYVIGQNNPVTTYVPPFIPTQTNKYFIFSDQTGKPQSTTN
ncbi:putative capsid protein [Pacific flying fox faeces associated circular DNA virus-7]|nr:putative capsid protein [Pacific flying fox faeces associated circular DNA virus-7]